MEHSATLLADRKRIFVAGGHAQESSTDAAYSSSPIYDTAADTWIAGPDMLHSRDGHQAALLSGSGKVLLVSGDRNHILLLDDYEIFDPAVSKLTSSGTLGVRIGMPRRYGGYE